MVNKSILSPQLSQAYFQIILKFHQTIVVIIFQLIKKSVVLHQLVFLIHLSQKHPALCPITRLAAENNQLYIKTR